MKRLQAFLWERTAEVDEKAVLMVILVLGTLGGVSLVAGKIMQLLNTAAGGL